MGDDVLDLPVLARVGLAAAPADAVPEVLARVAWVSRARGGDGAVRELTELVLKAQDAGTRCRRVDAGADTAMTVYLRCSSRWWRCWPAWPSARPGSATSCATASGSIAARRANLRTSSSASTWSSPTRSIAAIDELSRAAWLDEDALEIHLVLGNLYREKGQVGRAINIHQVLLQRPHLKPLEHAYILLCLGLDFRRGGFVDRAHEAFKEVLRLDPRNRHALVQLEKLHEEQHQWAEAYDIRQQLAEIDGRRAKARATTPSWPFSRTSSATRRSAAGQSGRGDHAASPPPSSATAPPRRRISTWAMSGARRRRAGAIAAWETLMESSPDRAYLAFDRLQAAYRTRSGRRSGSPISAAALIAANTQDWRARLALARHRSTPAMPAGALELLFEALTHNPHALMIHQEIWQAFSALGRPPQLVERYLEADAGRRLLPRPHVCVRCRYRSTELLWQCPQCHEWNTFIEERIAPAKDDEQLSA